MNKAWNFHFLWIDAVIQVACVVSWTSIFSRRMIVVVDLFIYWLEWLGTDWAVCGVVVFPLFFGGQQILYRFYWPGVCYKWLLWLGPSPKTFQQHNPPYLVVVVQSIVHQSILIRCSSHMEHDAGIGWWRILMKMAHTSLVYTEGF